MKFCVPFYVQDNITGIHSPIWVMGKAFKIKLKTSEIQTHLAVGEENVEL